MVVVATANIDESAHKNIINRVMISIVVKSRHNKLGENFMELIYPLGTGMKAYNK